MRNSFLVFLTLLSLNPELWAQKPTIQDCLGAIPICTEIYEEKNAPKGSGNYANEIFGVNDGGISCLDDERNSIWYTFTVNKSGNFGFVLTPNELFDDYDWALFDITNARCADIRNDISLQVSCNAAGGETCNGVTGADGGTIYDNQGGGCGYSPDAEQGFSAQNALIPVKKGNTYVLLVSNWTGSENGYKIDFSPSGDLGIFDNQPPTVLETILPADCDAESLKIEFSENVLLSSISSNNFILHGPEEDHQVLVSSLAHQVQGDYDKSFHLTFDPPITATGDYRLEIISNGSTDIIDLCGNPIQEVNDITFNIGKAALPPPSIEGDTLLCQGSTLELDVSNPRAISYLWSDNSTLPSISITQSGTYTIEIEDECGSSQSSITVDFANCDSCHVFVPSAFTPNGDGINDLLEVFSDCILEDFSISIYNRWGNLIHNSKSQEASWDGRVPGFKYQSATFVYVLQYKAQELGNVFYRQKSGEFSVIR